MSNVEPLKPREDGRLHPADVTIDQLIAVLEKLHPEGEDPTLPGLRRNGMGCL